MNKNDLKKQYEFQCILPLMKKLGYDACQAKEKLTPSEKPDFLFKYENKFIGLEVTECHPEITNGKNAKNQRAAIQRTSEICRFIEKYQDSLNVVINYTIGFNFLLLFDLQKAHLKRSEKAIIQNKVLAELQMRIKNGDYFTSGDDNNLLDKECVNNYKYTRYIIVDEPLERSILSYSYPARGLFPINQNTVLDAITNKNKKIDSYRSRSEIKEFWLCVYVPLRTNRTIEGIKDLKVKSPYDRVYLISEIKCIRIK